MIRLKRNFNIRNLSTFKIGEKVKFFCEVKNDTELLEAIDAAKKLRVPYKIIAGGSNVVFPDKKLNCFLIKIKSQKLKVKGNRIIADAGVLLSRVRAAANSCGLKGVETLAGIPGTIGGAIVGNAGAYGYSISEVVEKAEILIGNKTRWLKNRECKFDYRESIFKHKPWIILRAVLKFSAVGGKKGLPAGRHGDSKKLQKISRDIIKIRLKKYKPGLRCPGSFFKNVLVNPHTKRGVVPSARNLDSPRYGVGVKDEIRKALKIIPKNKIIDGKIPAGYLLEEVGAKGMQIGGIKIADFHGNLFINQGGAKANDVKKMAKILKERVKKKFGIVLEEEIRYF